MLDELYLRSPRPVQNLALSLLGVKNRVTRHGRWFRAHRAFLAESENWEESQLADWQNHQLAALLRHASATVPYFRSLVSARTTAPSNARDSLAELPPTDKHTLKQDPDAFLSDAFRSRRVVRVKTSGTTGSPMTFVIDRRSRQMHFAFFERLLRWANLESTAWHGVFMGRILGAPEQLQRQPWRTDVSNRRDYYSSYHITRSTIKSYMSHLVRRRHEWIEGYPSAIGNLARLGLLEGLDFPRPKAVIPSSETLDDATRTIIERAFGNVIWEFYASAEQAAFISQCEAGSLHINPEYGIIEFEPRGHNQDGEGLHELIATSFLNRAMPLIRYRTDDLVVRDTRPCPCGRAFPSVKRIVGRTSQAVLLPDGRRVTGISNVPKGLPIAKSQLVQVSDAAFEFLIIPTEPHWDRSAQETVEKRLQDRLGDTAHVIIRIVPEIPPGPNGKTPLVKALPSKNGES